MASKRDMIKETRSTLIVKFKVSRQVELMITGDEGGKIFFQSLSTSTILCATF